MALRATSLLTAKASVGRSQREAGRFSQANKRAIVFLFDYRALIFLRELALCVRMCIIFRRSNPVGLSVTCGTNSTVDILRGEMSVRKSYCPHFVAIVLPCSGAPRCRPRESSPFA